MKTLLKYQGPAILWALFIFIMCTINLGKVSDEPFFFPGFDKLAHCGFFFVLVVLYSCGIIRQQNPPSLSYKSAAGVTGIAITYGGIIEILQQTIFTWRTSEWGDLFADSMGSLMGVFSILLTIKAINYVKK
ncbi:hypothetical protein BH09BAC6_BH09BAC6_15440 [soil metagenome]